MVGLLLIFKEPLEILIFQISEIRLVFQLFRVATVLIVAIFTIWVMPATGGVLPMLIALVPTLVLWGTMAQNSSAIIPTLSRLAYQSVALEIR